MMDMHAKLKGILSEVTDLAGAVAFGQSRLQEFHSALRNLTLSSTEIKQYQQYQFCTHEHRQIATTLLTTVQSLIEWRALAMAHSYELNEYVISVDDSLYPLKESIQEKIEKLLDDLNIHIQQLEQMQYQSASIAHGLIQKKRQLPVLI